MGGKIPKPGYPFFKGVRGSGYKSLFEFDPQTGQLVIDNST